MRVPYLDGSLMHYPQKPFRGEIEWRESEAFVGTLKLKGLRRGRSAAYFIWQDEQGHEYPMFLTDLEELLRQRTVFHGKTTGLWAVQKRGMNYGIRIEETP